MAISININDKILHDPKLPEFCINILYVLNYDDCLYSRKIELNTPVKTRQCTHTTKHFMSTNSENIFVNNTNLKKW